MSRVKVTREGRDGVWLVGKGDLKAFLKDRGLETVHNFRGGGSLTIGADHDIESVIGDIDRADRLALLTGRSKAGNMGHALALVIGNSLEMFDIGDLTEDDLEIQTEEEIAAEVEKLTQKPLD